MEKCHDCGVKEGKKHLPNCDWEECPFCRGQLLSCGCIYEILNISYDNDPTDNQMKKWEKKLKKKGYIRYGQEIRFDK